MLLRLSVLRSAFGDLELREPGTLGRRVCIGARGVRDPPGVDRFLDGF